MSDSFSTQQVQHTANLANIPVTAAELEELATSFNSTLAVINNLKELDTSQVEPVHQVTGLENVIRSDEVDHERMFTQEAALSNATQTHNGYFVVPAVLKNKASKS